MKSEMLHTILEGQLLPQKKQTAHNLQKLTGYHYLEN
jgi:hypothetical protein